MNVAETQQDYINPLYFAFIVSTPFLGENSLEGGNYNFQVT